VHDANGERCDDWAGDAHLRSIMMRSMSSPTRSTNNRSLLLSASRIDGSASIGPSGLLSVSAGVGLDAGKGDDAWLSVSGRDDKTAGIVKGSAWGESVVVREETRVASAGRDEEDGDSLEARTVTETVRVDVSLEERKEGREVSERG
jgi:hypothetical protein